MRPLCLVLALLLALAPAFNLAIPVTPRISVAGMDDAGDMARTVSVEARSGRCLHEEIAGSAEDLSCGEADHAGDAHHVDPLCLQCVALGSPGMPGAPDIAAAVPSSVATASYRCDAGSTNVSRYLTAQFCRGPPYVV